MSNDFCIWAQVDDEIPWQDWWPALCTHLKWDSDLVIERWSSTDLVWSRVMDSANSFTLFKQSKAIVVLEAEKGLKGEKEPEKILEKLGRGPHRIVFQSTSEPPASIQIPVWQAPESLSKNSFSKVLDEKAVFRWMDAIHTDNLTIAITALDSAVEADQHPLALLQTLTRDFRIGRLIHHAHQNRFRESEIAGSLRAHPFVIQKWLKRGRMANPQWAILFDRLLAADLELKSGAQGIWVLRKLTFDLVQMTSTTSKTVNKLNLGRKLKKPSPSAPLLWTASPSFA